MFKSWVMVFTVKSRALIFEAERINSNGASFSKYRWVMAWITGCQSPSLSLSTDLTGGCSHRHKSLTDDISFYVSVTSSSSSGVKNQCGLDHPEEGKQSVSSTKDTATISMNCFAWPITWITRHLIDRAFKSVELPHPESCQGHIPSWNSQG